MNSNKNVQEDEEIAFIRAFEPFVADITSLDTFNIQNEREASEISEALEWFREAIYYNLPGGKNNRGLGVVMTHKILSEHYKQKPILEKARIIGWCIEMFQAYFLILDDIMDESLTRRGKKCWHLKKKVGNIAINDTCFMQQTIFLILAKHFIDSPHFENLLNLIVGAFYRTATGQCLDLQSSPKPGELPNLKKFTIDKYNVIIDNKTACYSFSLPVRMGMILSGLVDPITHQKADKILRRIGQLFQVQDDFLDCFGDPIVMGKIGTDIADGKCSWPIVTALIFADSDQRYILEQNYGRKDKANIQAVKSVFKELNIEKIFEQYERDSIVEIQASIEEYSKETQIPSEIFYSMLSKICGRRK